MEKIRSETGRLGESLAAVVGGVLNILLFMKLCISFGIEPPLPESPWLCLAVLIMIATALACCELVLFAGLHWLFVRFMQAAEIAAERGRYLMTQAAEAAAAFTVAALKFAALPVRIPCRIFWDAYVAPRLERRRQNAELRGMYERVKDLYDSYDEFVRYFEEGAKESAARSHAAPEAGSADPFRAACRTLGLPEAGGFSQAEFKARYQTMIKAVHPDTIGPNALASQVNEARDLIKARKGWK
jgi:hypothetical protein